MKTDSIRGRIRYLFGPVFVYAVVNSLVTAAMEIIRLRFLDPVFAVEGAGGTGGPAGAYALQVVWYLLTLVLAAGAGLFAVYGDVRRERLIFANRRWETPGLRRQTLPVLMTATVFLALGINSFFGMLADRGILPVTGSALDRRLPGLPGLLVQALVFCLFMPMVEEAVFRGLLVSRMEGLYGTRTGVAVSALLFGIYHASPAQGIYAFLMGIVFGAAYCRTGKFQVPFGLHGACNMAVLCLHWTGSWQRASSGAWPAAFLGIAAAGFMTMRKMESDRRQ